METTTQERKQESMWTQLDKAEAVNRQRRASEIVHDYFKGGVEIDTVISSLDHLRTTNGKSVDTKCLPLELRSAIIDTVAAAEYVGKEGLFSRKIEAFRRSHGGGAISKKEEIHVSQMASEFQAWCALSESEKEICHNLAEATLLKFFIMSSHVQDDGSLCRHSLGADAYSELATRLTIESQLETWLRIDSHDKITAGHAELMETLESVVKNLIENPTRFSLDLKLGMIDLFFAMKSAQGAFEKLTQPADLSRFGECMRRAEVTGEKYLLAEQAA